MASKAMAVTRTRIIRMPAKRRAGARKARLSLGIAGGIAVGIANTNSEITGSASWKTYAKEYFASFTGYHPDEKKFGWVWARRGLAPLAVGMAAHVIAQRTGLNRMISRYVPMVSI